MLRSLVLILSLFMAPRLRAGAEAGQPGGYLRAGVGARAAALGNAYGAAAEGPEAVYWNPAGLAWERRPSLSTMVSTLSLNRQFGYAGLVFAWDSSAATRNARAAAFPAAKGPGAWGLGWLNFSLGDDFEGRTADTASFYSFGDRQNTYLLSHGRALFPWWSLGASLKRYERRLDSFEASGLGLDAGTLLLLGSQMRVSIQVQDLASQLTWSTGYQERMPLTLRTGLGLWVWKERLLFLAQAEEVSGRQPSFSVGIESLLAGVFALRGGWQKDGPTLGGGLNLQVAQLRGNLDYAYLPDPLQQGNAQRISVGISF